MNFQIPNFFACNKCSRTDTNEIHLAADTRFYFLQKCDRVDIESALADAWINIVEMIEYDAGRIVNFNCPLDHGRIKLTNTPYLFRGRR